MLELDVFTCLPSGRWSVLFAPIYAARVECSLCGLDVHSLAWLSPLTTSKPGYDCRVLAIEAENRPSLVVLAAGSLGEPPNNICCVLVSIMNGESLHPMECFLLFLGVFFWGFFMLSIIA